MVKILQVSVGKESLDQIERKLRLTPGKQRRSMGKPMQNDEMILMQVGIAMLGISQRFKGN